ncbi:MAG TPA: hypothetical protein PLN21_17920 [Gemmatales bacterium]|nr:hypothetical protein [Gemmatales bacterium]
MCGLLLALSLLGLGVTNSLSYPDMLHRQGLMYAFDGKYLQAEQSFTEALRLEPQNESLWKFRSMTRGMLRNSKGAEADWIESEKWSDEQLDQSIETAFRQSDWATVLFNSELLYRNNRLTAYGLYRRGIALIKSGQIPAGYQIIKRAMQHEEELESLRGHAHFLCAAIIRENGTATKRELEEAVQHCDLAWKYECRSTSLLLFRARLNKELNKTEAALTDLRKAVNFDKRSTECRVILITTLIEYKRWADAEEEMAWLRRMTLAEEDKKLYSQRIAVLEGAIASNKPNANSSDSSARNYWMLDLYEANDNTKKLSSSFPPRP